MIYITDEQKTLKAKLEKAPTRSSEEQKFLDALNVLEAQSKKLEEAKVSGEGIAEAQEAFDAAHEAVEEAEEAEKPV